MFKVVNSDEIRGSVKKNFQWKIQCVLRGEEEKMANPRKFSEKIALLNQKEAEGNAEFERIMREVSEVSSKVDNNDELTRHSLSKKHISDGSNQPREEKKILFPSEIENLRCSKKKAI